MAQTTRSSQGRAMRVALSCGTVLNGQGRDGIGVYTAALAAHLPAAGVDVVGFALGDAPQNGPDIRLDSYKACVVRDFLGLKKPLVLPADIVHFTDHHIVPSRLPTVATLHDAVPLKYPEWVSPRMRWLKNTIMKRMVRHADQIVAVSHFAVQELIEYFGVARDRITVVHGGIDEQWLTTPAAPSAEVKAPDGRILKDYFLCVGTLQPRKNFDNMIAAHLALPQATRQTHPLVIVGRPGWRCAYTVERLQALAEAGEPVYWLNNVNSRADLRAVYDSALALSFVSLYEGFGIPVLEAFATGTPVITSIASSLPEVAGAAALTVAPKDVDAIADAMLRMASSAELRCELVALGHERVREFTWSQGARKMAEVYAQMR